MQESNPLGPTNYTGSNTATSKYKVVLHVQTPITETLSSCLSLKDKQNWLALKESRSGRKNDGKGYEFLQTGSDNTTFSEYSGTLSSYEN